MVGIVGVAAAGRYQSRDASAVEDAHAFRLGRLAGPVQAVLRSLVEDLLITRPASVPAIPIAFVVTNVVAACTLPHFSIIEWLERSGDAALVVV